MLTKYSFIELIPPVNGVCNMIQNYAENPQEALFQM